MKKQVLLVLVGFIFLFIVVLIIFKRGGDNFVSSTICDAGMGERGGIEEEIKNKRDFDDKSDIMEGKLKKGVSEVVSEVGTHFTSGASGQRAVSGMQLRKSLKSAILSNGKSGVKVLGDDILPEKLLLPVSETQLADNDGKLDQYDRKVLGFINRIRISKRLKKLPNMPTGLNEDEALALMNAMRLMEGEKPLGNMPTGLKLK